MLDAAWRIRALKCAGGKLGVLLTGILEVLTDYDTGLPVKLACDASPYGLGTVMSHVMMDGSERPIAYASHTLTSGE